MAKSLGFGHFSAAQAGCANAHALVATFHLGVDGTQVDVPAPLGHVVSVADAVAELRSAAAEFTILCH